MLQPFDDPQHPGNSSEYHTGKPCIEKGCDRPAGTRWSRFWCQPCNAARMHRIDASLKGLVLSQALGQLGARVRPPSKGEPAA